MKMLIQKMFANEIEYINYDENLVSKVEEVKQNISLFKQKLFKKQSIHHNAQKCSDENLTIESFQDFGQHLVKKIKESNGDYSVNLSQFFLFTNTLSLLSETL